VFTTALRSLRPELTFGSVFEWYQAGNDPPWFSAPDPTRVPAHGRGRRSGEPRGRLPADTWRDGREPDSCAGGGTGGASRGGGRDGRALRVVAYLQRRARRRSQRLAHGIPGPTTFDRRRRYVCALRRDAPNSAERHLRRHSTGSRCPGDDVDGPPRRRKCACPSRKPVDGDWCGDVEGLPGAQHSRRKLSWWRCAPYPSATTPTSSTTTRTSFSALAWIQNTICPPAGMRSSKSRHA
jgi:hypothetical protein